MEAEQVLQLLGQLVLGQLVTPEDVLAFLGVFSVFAKWTPWEWDDSLEEKLRTKPEYLQRFVKNLLKVIHFFGLSKKF